MKQMGRVEALTDLLTNNQRRASLVLWGKGGSGGMWGQAPLFLSPITGGLGSCTMHSDSSLVSGWGSRASLCFSLVFAARAPSLPGWAELLLVANEGQCRARQKSSSLPLTPKREDSKACGCRGQEGIITLYPAWPGPRVLPPLSMPPLLARGWRTSVSGVVSEFFGIMAEASNVLGGRGAGPERGWCG